MALLDGAKIKRTLLEIIEATDGKNKRPATIQAPLESSSVLRQAFSNLTSQGTVDEEALLTIFNDLFRIGHLSWGLNLSNPNPPFFHLTEQGRLLLRNLSRDPFNPDGYLDYLKNTKLSDTTLSYLNEALGTFNSGFYKSTGVMIGGATESIILDLRSIILTNESQLNPKHAKDAKSFLIKTIIDAIKKILDSHITAMPDRLKEKYEANWPSFIHQTRRTRNDAGHPENIELFTFEDVHASLLIFPELAKLSNELEKWFVAL